MKRIFLVLVSFLFLFFDAVSQTQQDCPGANPICNSSYTYGTSFSGGGSFPSEVNTSSCMANGENNTVWFVFTAQSTGQIGFVISQPGTDPTDYDWAVYDLTGVGCSGSTISNANMVSCNFSATTGNTGPNGGSGSSSQGASGTPFNAYINATAGNNYAIVIDNYTGNSVGFTVDFGASPTSIVDNTDPEFLSVTTPPCGATSLTFAFSENIACSSVQTSDFTLTGPGGPYTITGINCNNGSTQSVTFTATISPAITASGSYSLNLVGSVTDLCGNVTPSDSKPFSVTNAANANWTPPAAMCTNASSVNLNSLITGTSGGTWSGTGVSGSTFNPATAGAGTHNVTYSVTVGGCTDTRTQSITVNAVPNATISAAGPFCTTDAATNLSAATGGGTWSGTGITNASAGTFNPSSAGAGTHTITYSVTSAGCTGTDTESITVNATPNATITAAGPFCTSDAATNLTAASGGGTWSGTGITNSSLGTFNPSTAGAGTHTITYNVSSGGCSNSDTETITVNATPNATITAAGPFCTTDAATNLNAATGGGTWSGTGITNTSAGTFDPASAGVGTHTITYSVTSGSCIGTDTETITVNSSSNATITAAGPFCTSDAATNLSAAQGGGTWSGTGITNSALGTFNPATAGAGTHTITYTIGGSCGSSDTETITVTANPNPTITAAGPFCTSDAATNLNAATAGGTWSGTGITNASAGTFDPAFAGAGNHTVTYSVSSSGCSSSDTEIITVNANPDATITPVGALCPGDAPVTLSAATSGGTFSGTGVSGNTFDPAVAGVGTHTITYTVTVNGCSGIDTETITVNNSSDPTITPVSALCAGDSPVTLTAATGGGAWSGTGVSGSTFDPGSAGAGTHTITYTISGACGSSDTETITVNANPDATINAAGPFCTTDAATNLAAATAGGTWSGTGITNASAGTFDPASAGTGTFTITYNVSSGGCSGTDTETITVNTTPDATIAAAGPFCTTDASVNLTSATGGGTWNGTGITNASSGTFDPATAGAGTHTVTYSVSVSGCTGTDTESIMVNTTPDATITAAGPFCTADASMNLAAATGGGTWGGAGITNTSTGAFDPATAGPGTHVISYSVSGSGCTGTDTESITVNATPDATITPIGSLCPGDAPVTLTAATGGGTFSGTGVSGNTFDPAMAGAGSHTITYTVTVNGCTSTDTEIITVSNSTDATINPVSPLCTGDSPIPLTAATGGGTWSGTGVTGSSFNPAMAGQGTHTVTYIIGGSCGSSDTETITVTANPDATITPLNSMCTGDAPASLSAATGGGTFSGTGVFGNTFDPAVSGAGTFTINYNVTSGGCSSSDSITVTVNSNSDATITPIGPFCTGDSPMSLTAASGGGTWSGNGVTGNFFDPALAGVGTHTIIYAISSACGDTDSVSIIVNPSNDATINASGPFCSADNPVNLTAVTGGGTWNGTGITNPASGTFNPSVAGTGTHLVTYTISGACGSSDTTFIIVNPQADATITPPGPLCSNDAPVNLTAAQSGGTWSGTGVTGSSFDPSISGPGTFAIIYSIGGACGSSDTDSVTVNPSSDATINATGPFCASDPPVNMTSAQSGGIWSGNGITNTSTGTFNPAIAGTGSHLITYTINGSCGDVDTILVIVNPPADATITSAGPYCDEVFSVNLTANDSGGFWTGPGVTGSQFFPSLLTPGNYTITYIIPGSCGDTDSVSIQVIGTPDATINDPGPLCDTTAVFNLTAADPGGTWSGTGITNSSSGTFDPSVSGSGTFTIAHINTNAMCSDSDTVMITVGNVPPAPSAASAVICYTEVPFTLSATGSGGQLTWYYSDSSGNILTQNDSIFIPAVADSVPDSTYYYCVLEQNGNCPSSCTPVTLSIVNIDASFASPADSGEIPYTVVFDNTSFGVDSNDIFMWYFGDGDSSALYNPTHVFEEIGDYTIMLTVSDSGKICSDTYTLTIHTKGSSSVLVPNIFSPNGDNVNDVFNLIYKNLTSVEGIIYNRWGELIYQWSSVEAGWDGRTMSGTMAPEGVYYYLIKATGTDEPEPKKYEFHGFVTLVR